MKKTGIFDENFEPLTNLLAYYFDDIVLYRKENGIVEMHSMKDFYFNVIYDNCYSINSNCFLLLKMLDFKNYHKRENYYEIYSNSMYDVLEIFYLYKRIIHDYILFAEYDFSYRLNSEKINETLINVDLEFISNNIPIDMYVKNIVNTINGKISLFLYLCNGDKVEQLSYLLNYIEKRSSL